MSEPPAISAADASRPVSAQPEMFWGTVLRRVRYGVAITISAYLFATIGYAIAGPPAQVAGVSLLYWQGHSALLSVAGLGLLLLAMVGVASLICHPDSPHQGLWCALLGVLGLAVRGGTAFTVIQFAQSGGPDHYAAACRTLALECVYWAVLFVLAETFARYLHERFFANTRWITRISEEAAAGVLKSRTPARTLAGGSYLGLAGRAAGLVGRLNIPAALANPLALISNLLLASLFLYVLLQSLSMGQVIYACFLSFLAASFISARAFPNVSALVFLLTVPLTAAVGYLIAANYPGLVSPQGFPGHPGNFFARALPIDYFAAGIPGAITGFYTAFHMTLHSHLAEKNDQT